MFDRPTMERATVSYFRRGWKTLPDIRLVEHEGRRWVVKDWGPRGLLRRLTQGRFMLRREHRFLRRLEGLPGIPRSFGFPDRDSLAIEYLESRPVSKVHPEEYVEGYWDRLDALVRAVHERGVAHGDLDQEDNIMVCEDGSPAIIDFGGAISRWVISPLHLAAFDLLSRHDLGCVERLRMKKDLFPGRRRAPRPPRLLGWQRRLLLLFNKLDRKEERRTHGVGEAP
jgi:serine/threonine protein kinase